MAIVFRKSRNGNFAYQVRVKDRLGRWYEAKSFSRQIDAEEYERQLLNSKDSNDDAKSRVVRELTLETYVLEKWANDCRSKVSEGWRITQDQMIRDYILPVLGNRKLKSIRPEDIGSVFRKMEALGRGGQTRRHVYNILHHIFDAACEYHNVLSRNPVLKRDKPEVPVTERTVLKPDQAMKLLDFSRNQYIGPAIWIGLLAALRPNEIQALKWSAIDFDRNLIHIKSGFKRKVNKIEPYPKQRRHGSTPMIPILKNFLLELREGRNVDDFVIAGIEGSVLSYGTFLVHLKSLCKKAGLPEISPHELRHSCTEIWCENGATEEDIVRLLNQSGSGSVRRYIHKSPDRILKIAQGIDISSHVKLERPKLRLVKL